MIPTKDALERLARLDRRRGRQKIILYCAMGILGVLAVAQERRWTAIHPAGWAVGALVIIGLATLGIACSGQDPSRRLRDYFIQHRLFHEYCLSGASYILILRFGDQVSHLDKSLTGSREPSFADTRLNPRRSKALLTHSGRTSRPAIRLIAFISNGKIYMLAYNTFDTKEKLYEAIKLPF